MISLKGRAFLKKTPATGAGRRGREVKRHDKRRARAQSPPVLGHTPALNPRSVPRGRRRDFGVGIPTGDIPLFREAWGNCFKPLRDPIEK